MSEQPRKGFVCVCCGNCCRWGGVVHLQDGEILAIAENLHLSPLEFTEQYTELSDDRKGLVLKNQSDGRCCFLGEDNRCRIQEAKPFQCSSFPYAWKPTSEQETLCHGYWEDVEC